MHAVGSAANRSQSRWVRPSPLQGPTKSKRQSSPPASVPHMQLQLDATPVAPRATSAASSAVLRQSKMVTSRCDSRVPSARNTDVNLCGAEERDRMNDVRRSPLLHRVTGSLLCRGVGTSCGRMGERHGHEIILNIVNLGGNTAKRAPAARGLKGLRGSVWLGTTGGSPEHIAARPASAGLAPDDLSVLAAGARGAEPFEKVAPITRSTPRLLGSGSPTFMWMASWYSTQVRGRRQRHGGLAVWCEGRGV